MSRRLASGFTRYASRVVPTKSFPLICVLRSLYARRFRTHQPDFSLIGATTTWHYCRCPPYFQELTYIRLIS